MMYSEAKKYHGYAREILRLAQGATSDGVRQQLLNLSRFWMVTALREKKIEMESRHETDYSIFG
jgi:hypothetical protein